MLKTRTFKNCPKCNAPLIPTIAFSGAFSINWLECSRCNTYVNTYIPMEHQQAVHKDTHKYIGNFGAYGTGKTTTSQMEVEKHCLITPGGHVLIGAKVASQYEATIQRDLERDLPAAFIADSSKQKAYIDLINGCRISYRPFDDPGKFRSRQFSLGVMLEASEYDAEAFHELKTRMRHPAAFTYKRDKDGKVMHRTLSNGQQVPIIDHDWRKLIVESNPDSGWIRTDVLLNSDIIQRFGKVYDEIDVEADRRDPYTASFVASTDVNEFLPPTYIAEQCKNKPEWWVKKFIYGSFAYSEGRVYPKAMDAVIPYFTPPLHWKRMVAFDYGLSDDAAWVFGAIDEDSGILYIYDSIIMNNENVEALATAFKMKAKDVPIGGWYGQPIMDPKNNKRDYNKKDLATHFAELGIAFEPGHVSVDARILRLNTYFETGKIKIMDNNTYLIGQLREYKFEARTLDAPSKKVKPIDKDNHAINPVEWIVMKLPHNPKLLQNLSYNMQNPIVTPESTANANKSWQLADDYDIIDFNDYSMVNTRDIF